mmetsp:Transcript_12085/g.28890  ORF Transcript_12085/g.28890 Transcript_12085/m.28890 type:complete len:285 (-) Transcript_12085:156-1010(-)
MAGISATEDVLPLAIGQGHVAHVLHDSHGRDVKLAEHGDASLHVDHAQLLRGGDDHSCSNLADLRQGQVDIARSRRHVQDEVVELAPVCLVHQLRHHACDHGTPHHRRMSDKTKGDHLDASVRVDDGADVLLLLFILVHLHLWRVFLEADHDGQGRPVDVAVENADFEAFVVQREGQVHSHSAFPNATFTGGHRDDALHILQGLWHLRHRPWRIGGRGLGSDRTYPHFHRLGPGDLGESLLDLRLVDLHLKDQGDVARDAVCLDLPHEAAGDHVRPQVRILDLL